MSWVDIAIYEGGVFVDEGDMNEIRGNLNYLKSSVDSLSSSNPGVNLVKNFPSLELADGEQPLYFDVTGDPTLTEEDATGESIEQKFERVLKFISSADGGDSDEVYQKLTIADEPTLDESTTVVSVGVWVLLSTAGTVTLSLYDDGGAVELGSDSTTVVGTWTFLSVINTTIGSTSISWKLKHSENDATFYVTMPVLTPGAVVGPWQPRRIVFKEYYSSDIGSAQANWTDLDCSSYVSPLAVMGRFRVYAAKAATGTKTYMRRNGDATDTNALIVSYGYAGNGGEWECLFDEEQIVEYKSSGVETSYELYLTGYWEWES